MLPLVGLLLAAPPAAGPVLAAPPLDVQFKLPAAGLGRVPVPTALERDLLSKVYAQKTKGPLARAALTNDQLLDLMLFASGVEAPAARRDYRARFERVAAEAVKACRGLTTRKEKGEKLMQVLHAGPLRGGYQTHQTSLSVAFDTGKYNCVSAAALYALVGARLGLDLRGMSIAGKAGQDGHAALDLIDGPARVQVEPTSPHGFDWAGKLRRGDLRLTDDAKIPDRSTARETDLVGLAGMMYSNRAVGMVKEKPARRPEAARCLLAALCLDPADPILAGNLEGLFVNWGPALTEAKRPIAAAQVLGLGRTLFPKSDKLKTNQRAAWALAVRAAVADGRDELAVRAAGRAAAAVPDEPLFREVAPWFLWHAAEDAAPDDYEAKALIADRGLEVVRPADARPLLEYRLALVRRASEARLDRGDLGGSLDALGLGFDRGPDDPRVRAGIAYHTQEALALADRRGPAALLAHWAAVRRRFPNVPEVADGGRRHALRAVEALLKAEKFEAAADAVGRYGPLLADPKRRAELAGRVYDAWAAPAVTAGDWAEAVRVYDRGLERFPGDPHLLHNRRACAQKADRLP